MLASGSALPGLISASLPENDLIADLQAVRCDDVSLLAVFVLHECDESGTVRVVLEGEDRSSHVVLLALEVDHTVLLAVAAASVANGDSAVAVAAGSFILQEPAGSSPDPPCDNALKSVVDMLRRACVVGL